MQRLAIVHQPFDRLLMTLSRLTPPLREAASYRRVLRSIGAVDRKFHLMLHDLNTRQYGVFVRRFRAESPGINAILKHAGFRAKKLGLTVCAKS